VVSLGVFLVAAPAAAAGEGAGLLGWEEALRYALCALTVAAASSGVGLVAAIVGCIFNELFN
jgi:hypothetical protein